MNTLAKILIFGIGGVGLLSTGFINIQVPVFAMQIFHRTALAIWSIDGIIDASFIFDCLYYVLWIELAVFCFHIYKWLTQFFR